MRAVAVLAVGTWDTLSAADSVLLDHDHRHRRRIALRTEAGSELLLDLPQAARLRDGDGLALEDGGIVRAKSERLLEIYASDDATLLRIAWHLGNRHLPVQVSDKRLRIRTDHVIADLVVQLEGTVEEVEAPFDPEAGAYAGGHHHDNDHDHHG